MKDLNKKQKIVIGAGVIGTLLIAAIIFAMNLGKPTYNQEEVLEEDKGTLTLEYGLETEDKYDVSFSGEVLSVTLPEEVTTEEVSKNEYVVDTEQGNKTLVVVVEDTQEPTIEGPDNLEIDIDYDEEKLVEELNELFIAKDPIDGEVEIEYEIPNTLEYEKEAEHEILLVAKDINGNRTTKKLSLSIVDVEKVAREKEEEEARLAREKEAEEKKEVASESTGTNSGSSNSGSSNSGSSNSGSSNSGGSSSGGSSSGGSSSGGSSSSSGKAPSKTSKPAPAESKPIQNEESPQPAPGNTKDPDTPSNPGVNSQQGTLVLKNPSYIPSGAKLISDSGNENVYSYQKNYAGSSKLLEIRVSSIAGHISMGVRAMDENGDSFSGSLDINNNLNFPTITRTPVFTNGQVSDMREVLLSARKAYQ